MDRVAFRCHISADGEDEVRRWYTAQSPSVRAAVYAELEALGHRPAERWRRKPYGVLRGAACSGLGEIRIEHPRGVHYRILGFFDAERTCFTLLYPFLKSTDPAYAIACPESQRRRSDVERNDTRARNGNLLAA